MYNSYRATPAGQIISRHSPPPPPRPPRPVARSLAPPSVPNGPVAACLFSADSRIVSNASPSYEDVRSAGRGVTAAFDHLHVEAANVTEAPQAILMSFANEPVREEMQV